MTNIWTVSIALYFYRQHFRSEFVSIIGSQSGGEFLQMGPLEVGLGVDTTP
jgi:hypothetical protein